MSRAREEKPRGPALKLPGGLAETRPHCGKPLLSKSDFRRHLTLKACTGGRPLEELLGEKPPPRP